jgi:hypothetical protein
LTEFLTVEPENLSIFGHIPTSIRCIYATEAHKYKCKGGYLEVAHSLREGGSFLNGTVAQIETERWLKGTGIGGSFQPERRLYFAVDVALFHRNDGSQRPQYSVREYFTEIPISLNEPSKKGQKYQPENRFVYFNLY